MYLVGVLTSATKIDHPEHMLNGFDTIPTLPMHVILHSVRSLFLRRYACRVFFFCCWGGRPCGFFGVLFNVADYFYGILLINLLIALNLMPCIRVHTAHLWCMCKWYVDTLEPSYVMLMHKHIHQKIS